MKHPIPVTLSESERASLQTFIHAGKANARTFTRARALLKAAEGWTDQQICDALDISRNTSIRVRQMYLEGGLEAVLDRDVEEDDPRYPRVCFDEKLVAPEAEVRPREPMKPGQAERVDDEYERLGTANLFFFVDPARGWRHVEMTEHRTKIDYAR